MRKKIYAIMLSTIYGVVCHADASINPGVLGNAGISAANMLNMGGPFNGATIAGPVSGTRYTGIDIAKMSLLHNISSSHATTPVISSPQGGGISTPIPMGSSSGMALPGIHQNKPIFIRK
jgi:hypothetical protein